MTNELHEILKDLKYDINIISSMITSIEVSDLIGEKRADFGDNFRKPMHYTKLHKKNGGKDKWQKVLKDSVPALQSLA